MNRILKAALYACLIAPLVAACGDDDDDDDDTKPPAAPTLGAMIDRMGRPAINTALNNTFAADATAAGTAKDNYNKAAVTAWSGNSTEFAKNLAILDSLDTNCGNQLLAGTTATAGRYNGLAGVLADDKLWVNSASVTCGQYLAVEANATGAAPNTDCGGRTLTYDVIDTSYSVLAVGALMGVGDDISSDTDGPQSNTTFPFILAPR